MHDQLHYHGISPIAAVPGLRLVSQCFSVWIAMPLVGLDQHAALGEDAKRLLHLSEPLLQLLLVAHLHQVDAVESCSIFPNYPHIDQMLLL